MSFGLVQWREVATGALDPNARSLKWSVGSVNTWKSEVLSVASTVSTAPIDVVWQLHLIKICRHITDGGGRLERHAVPGLCGAGT
jgi:hypothetical protein